MTTPAASVEAMCERLEAWPGFPEGGKRAGDALSSTLVGSYMADAAALLRTLLAERDAARDEWDALASEVRTYLANDGSQKTFHALKSADSYKRLTIILDARAASQEPKP